MECSELLRGDGGVRCRILEHHRVEQLEGWEIGKLVENWHSLSVRDSCVKE